MFYDNLKQALEKQEKKVSPFLKEMGYSSSNATKWKSGKLPDTEILIRICEKLNVSADVLLDINVDALKDNNGITDEEKRIIYSYRKHPEMKTAVFKILEIKEREKKMDERIVSFECMNFQQRRCFKSTMKEHFVNLYSSIDIYEKLNNALGVDRSIQWFKTVEDVSLDSRIPDMLDLISKTPDTFFSNLLFEVKTEEEAKMLGVEWNGSARLIERADAFIRLSNVADQPSRPLNDNQKTTAETVVESNATFLDESGVYMIPLYESASAGFGKNAINLITGYEPCYIPNPADVDDTLCITVSGDSMSPKIEEGDIIQVRKQESVDSGSVAVVLLDGEEGLVKKVVYGDDWIELHSFNPEYQTMRFEGPDVLRLRVVGLVKAIIKRL